MTPPPIESAARISQPPLRLLTPTGGTPTPPTWRARAFAWWRAHGPLFRAAAPTWALIVLASTVLGLSVYVYQLRGWVVRNMPARSPPTAQNARDMAGAAPEQPDSPQSPYRPHPAAGTGDPWPSSPYHSPASR